MKEKFEAPRKTSEPTEDTAKAARKWQEENKFRREKTTREKAIKELDAKQKKAQEEMKNRTTNAQVAESPEFQAWCREQGIEPTTRAASKHRKQFEAEKK